MLLDLTVSREAPPHLAHQLTGHRVHEPRIRPDELPALFAETLRLALESGLFDGGGCLNVVVQRSNTDSAAT